MIQETLTTILGILRKHGIFLIVFFWLVAVLYVGLRDKSPEIIFSQDYFIAILTIIPVLIAIMFGFGLIKSFDLKTLTPMQITKIITSILAIAGIFYGIWYLNTPQGKSEDAIVNADVASQIMFFFNIISAVIVIFGLIIFARLLKDVAYSVEGWIGIFLRIIFFIPCLFSDLFSYFAGQFAQSPFVVYVLIAIEIALILLYLYLPKLLAKFASKAGNQILSDPVSLNKQTSISSLGNVYKKGNLNPNFAWHNKYSFSLWFYIVAMPPTKYPYNEDATIFSLTDGAGIGHPKVMYNGSKNKCIVQYANSNGPPSSVEFKIPLQKWVHLVTVYDYDNVDFFMNGTLVKSVTRTNNVALKMDDSISVGQENGLTGSVSNIMHYARPLSKKEIGLLYKLGHKVIE